jgi:hypothetical protein
MLRNSELMSMDVSQLKAAIETKIAELETVQGDLEALPLDGTPTQNLAAKELDAEMQDRQQTIVELRRRLLKIEPAKQNTSFPTYASSP